jgi:hypothetical protein
MSNTAWAWCIRLRCRYCADPNNTIEIQQILTQREYVGTKLDYIHLGDPSANSNGQIAREYDHHLFFGDGINRPSRTEHLWHMVQMARWGDVPFPRNWVEVLERTCQVSAFSTAARELGISELKYTRGPIRLFDGSTFNADDPIAYLNSLPIKRDFTMADVVMGSVRSAA